MLALLLLIFHRWFWGMHCPARDFQRLNQLWHDLSPTVFGVRESQGKKANVGALLVSFLHLASSKTNVAPLFKIL